MSVWAVVGGIATSGLVSLCAGLITIYVSWHTSRHFGKELHAEIVNEFRQALATSVASTDELATEIVRVVDEAQNDERALLILVLGGNVLELLARRSCSSLSDSLKSRFSRDLPTVLAIPARKWLYEREADLSDTERPNENERQFWGALTSETLRDKDRFNQLFATRKALILPLESIPETLAACLKPGGPSGYEVSACLWAQVEGAITIGVRSNVDLRFAELILHRTCTILEEPFDTYMSRALCATDLLAGRLTGVPVTRSIITSQLLLGVHRIFGSKPAADGTRRIEVASRTNQDRRGEEFVYSPEQFLPPLYTDKNHSGSVLATAIHPGRISIEGRNGWEVGCGPGYLTRILAEACQPGQVIANDISDRAIEIAKRNVLLASCSNVRFLLADCLTVNTEIREVNDKYALFVLNPAEGSAMAVDWVVIELPLLPYHGRRSLTVFERSYFESVPSSRKTRLPTTVVKLLEKLKTALEQTPVEVLLPVCAATQEELQTVREDVRSVLGGAVEIVVIDNGQGSGFLHVLLLRSRGR